MGNGRWWGRSSGSGSVWVRAFGAMFLLLLAGSVLLGFGSLRHTQKALAPLPSSPIPTSSGSSQHPKPDARALLGQLPLIFEPNQGQADPRVKFLARGKGYSLFLDPTGAALARQTAPRSRGGHSDQLVRMKLVGGRPVAIAGINPLPGKSNYIIGNDPNRWRRGIPQSAGVRYEGVYPGIDLVFYGNQGRLEYDFRVAPGADPSQAQLQFEGASKLKLNGGDLILSGKDGGLRLQAPHIYQRDGERDQPVAGRFVLRAANRVGFEIGPYDRGRELIIDPVLSFSTYFGGSGSETSPSVAVNGDGFIYLVGSTTSSSAFPLNGTASTQLGTAANIFVAKISPAQPPAVIYATFLGGSGGPGADTSVGIGVDSGGNAYIAGNTSSTDFPTSGTNVLGYQTVPETKGPQCASVTCTSVFVSVLNSLGSGLNYSSYLSGNGNDQASGMTIDTKGDVFVTGTTTSNDTPSLNDAFPATLLPVPFQTSPSPGSSIQFFVTKVSTTVPSVGSVAYSTYFGGGTPIGAVATGGGIAVDSTGNIYFDGTTNFYNSGSGVFGDSGQSEDFPILNAYQPCLNLPPPTVLANPNPCPPPAGSAPTDGFVAKLNPLAAAGTQLLFSTYLGGTGTDTAAAIGIDSGAANIFLTGSTNSSDFIIPTGVAPFQLCLDTPPVTPPNVPPCPVMASPAPFDAYVARVTNPTQSTTGVPINVALTYFSYLGGGGNDNGAAIAVDTASDALITGATSSTNFPATAGAIQSTLNGTQDAFFAHIDTTTITGQNQVGSYVSYFGGNSVDRGTSITVDSNLNAYFAGDTTSSNLQVVDPLPGPGGSTLNGTNSDAFVVKLGTATDLCITCVAPVLSPAGIVSAGNTVTITFSVTNEGPDLATNINVNGTVSAGATFNSATAGSGTCSAPSSNGVVCQIPTLQAGSTSAISFVVTPGTAGSYQVNATVSNSNDTNTNNTATASFTASGFSVSINPTGQTVSAGLPAKFAVTVAPTQGVFGANVSLSCSALPTGAACSFTNSTITLNGASSASTTLNLTTTAQPVNTVTGATEWRRPLYAFWLMVPGMAVLGLSASGKRRGKKSRWLSLLAFSVLFALVALQPSCSGAKTQPQVSGTPSGTYPLTVTATSGSFTRTAPFSLTVTP
jgi:uncharacterized repeat protein (TIGR01451 family)